MMGRQTVDQSQLFYLFNLEEYIPADHLLRRLNPIVSRVLVDVRERLAPFYSDIGRPSIDPELMIRMLIVGYCYGIRFERKLCEEVKLHLAYRWFCRLQLDDKVPDHSTFSVNRHGRFRSSNIFRQVFEAVVCACMEAGLVKGEGFAVDASVIEADASRYHGKAPDETWDKSGREDGTFSRADFTFDKERNVYICPAGKLLTTTGRVHDGRTILYRAGTRDCGSCQLKPKCTPNVTFRKIPRDVHEDARDATRALMGTPEFARSRNERKKVEMRFAHLKAATSMPWT